jgi:hypothetical protein
MGRKVDGLQELMPGTVYAPHATSLRMSDLGYRNKSQASLSVSVNSLEHYVRDLTAAINTPNPEYEKIGVKVDGEYRQLNANMLQIENEYYSFIRPKRVTQTASGRPRHCSGAVCSTSKCGHWMRACSTRSASTRTSCVSSRLLLRSACCTTTHRSRLRAIRTRR